MRTKNYQKIETVREVLIKSFGDEVKYIDIAKNLETLGIHDINFYYFVYAGCFEKVKTGVYRKTPKFYSLTIRQVKKLAYKKLDEMRKNYLLRKHGVDKYKPKFSPAVLNELNEQNCISFLKEKGYKILKPQFAEI